MSTPRLRPGRRTAVRRASQFAFACAAAPLSAQSLHDAAASGDVGAVRRLIAADSEAITTRDARGFTALHRAVLAGQSDIVDLLLAAGADVNASQVATDLRPIDLAFQSECQGRSHLTERLLEAGAEFDPNALVLGRLRRLDYAVLFGNAPMVRRLIALGADPNAGTPYPMPPLVNAASRGREEIVRLLLDAGADPNITDRDERPALRLAVERGHADVVATLLAAGAEPGVPDPRDGKTVLHLAAIYGHLGIVNALLARGVDASPADRSGRTPAWYAARYGHGQVEQALTARGALIRRPDEPSNAARRATQPPNTGDAIAWYLNHRGWAVRTASHVLVFDAEEFGVTRPTEPGLANGFLTASELASQEIVGLYTTYHGEPGEPAYLHQLADSLPRVGFVHNAGDPWRGSPNTAYLIGGSDTTIAGVRVRTVDVTYEMTSLGYLCVVDGITIYYAGFPAEDPVRFAAALAELRAHADRVDLAFLPIPDGEDAEQAFRAQVATLQPEAILLLDPNRRETRFAEVAGKLHEWGYAHRVFGAAYPGDAFIYTRH